MRAVVQRVLQASVTIDGIAVASIGHGLLVLLGCEAGDGEADLAWLVGKIARLRIFADPAGKMNLDVQAIGGQVLVVSQFTLLASTARGNRPGFELAMAPVQAEAMYQRFLEQLADQLHNPVACGRFGADMQVALINDGPVTLIIDSRRRE